VLRAGTALSRFGAAEFPGCRKLGGLGVPVAHGLKRSIQRRTVVVKLANLDKKPQLLLGEQIGERVDRLGPARRARLGHPLAMVKGAHLQVLLSGQDKRLRTIIKKRGGKKGQKIGTASRDSFKVNLSRKGERSKRSSFYAVRPLHMPSFQHINSSEAVFFMHARTYVHVSPCQSLPRSNSLGFRVQGLCICLSPRQSLPRSTPRCHPLAYSGRSRTQTPLQHRQKRPEGSRVLC
jgi:hypothetical protein